MKKGSEQGDTFSMNKIADMYYEGNGVTKDYSKSYYYYKRSADFGSSVGLSNVGLHYECGYHVEQSYSKALECYQKSSR